MEGPDRIVRWTGPRVLSTYRRKQKQGQEESDQEEDRNERFVNRNRPGGVK